MKKLAGIFGKDSGPDELSFTTSRNLIATTGAFYLAWHFIATLGWPKTFNPSLWASTSVMLVAISLSLWLLPRSYAAAHAIWQAGLMTVILVTYANYQRPEVLLFLAALPLMTIITVGYLGTLAVEISILALIFLLPQLDAFPALPGGYSVGIVFASVFTGFLGWGVSNNLLSAIDSASHHYNTARQLLEETRQHRAEVSRMLKERNQVNYQLERLNEMLQTARTRAEEARAERDRFVLAISHELRSPLNFVIGFSDLMVNSPEIYADPKKWPAGLYDDIQEIYRSSTHLLGLINDILDMGQIDAHQMAIFREEVRLEQIIAGVREMVGRALSQKGLYLQVHVDEHIPSVFVDSTRIRQVLLNLVNNSLRFTENGGVDIHVERKPDAVQVCVADTGAGIAAEDASKIFEEFRQAGVNHWKRREGSGLGLPISRRFVELHGGKMWLESEVGKGTRFYFTIPLFKSSDETDPSTAVNLDASESGYRTDSREPAKNLVLLCSSNPLAGQMMRKWLDTYQVVTAKSLKNLPEQVRRYLPQAILLDKSMEKDTEFSTKDLPYPVPLISFYFPNTLSQNWQLPSGVSRYLVKPVTRQVLLEAVLGLGPGVRKLLVVEDDPAMVRFIVQTLKTGGKDSNRLPEYQILSANTGRSALDLMQEDPVDAVLLDLKLPDMDGWELLGRMRRIRRLPQPKVVVVSAGNLPQIFFQQGQTVLDVTFNRPLSQAELPDLLKSLTETIRPAYPMPADLAAPAPPAVLSE